MALLEIRDLEYQPDARPIIRRLTMTVAGGEIHALLGTNGTGKSTLAYLIMGCERYRPSAGCILFAGEPIDSLPVHERARRGIALAWQEPARFEGLSVRQYLDLHQSGIDPAPFLEQVGLNPLLYLDRQVDRTLSGGERKRIELASVLALRPRLAILDEPDSGIDMLSTAAAPAGAPLLCREWRRRPAHHPPGGDRQDGRPGFADLRWKNRLFRPAAGSDRPLSGAAVPGLRWQGVRP